VRKFMVGACASILVCSCAVGPNYQRPATPIDADFGNTSEAGFAPNDVVAAYWTVFNDPLLDRLIDDAVAHNNDLKAATANLRASRAERRLAGFDLYPTVTFSGGYTDALISQQQFPEFQGIPENARHFDTADAEFNALWELDLFGRVRRNVEAARADVGGVQGSLQDARVSVIAEVTRNYLILRGLQEQQALTLRNADNQFSTLKLTRFRLEAGRGNELDTSRAEAQWATTRATLPTLESSIATTMYRLSVLTGRQPTALNALLVPSAPQPVLPESISIGTPEQLLRRRPDVRVAERQLAAATARIGVAVGDLFPKVTVTGTFGYQAASFASLGDGQTRAYSFGPSISWPAFDLGRVLARVSFARAQTDTALARYQGAVLNALEDTERSLITSARTRARMDALQRAATASDKAADLARQRFAGGLIDFLEVLDAERTALSAELLLSQGRTDAATSLVAVYKALGGGWEGPTPMER
jgi:outer membrane protein, multidrug efflux system